jgi:hypothetical protein
MRCTLEFVRPLPVCNTVWPNNRQRFGRRRHIRFNGDSGLGAGSAARRNEKPPGPAASPIGPAAGGKEVQSRQKSLNRFRANSV